MRSSRSSCEEKRAHPAALFETGATRYLGQMSFSERRRLRAADPAAWRARSLAGLSAGACSGNLAISILAVDRPSAPTLGHVHHRCVGSPTPTMHLPHCHLPSPNPNSVSLPYGIATCVLTPLRDFCHPMSTRYKVEPMHKTLFPQPSRLLHSHSNASRSEVGGVLALQ